MALGSPGAPSDAEMLAHATASLLSSPIRMVKATRRTIDAALGRRGLPASSPPPAPYARCRSTSPLRTS